MWRLLLGMTRTLGGAMLLTCDDALEEKRAVAAVSAGANRLEAEILLLFVIRKSGMLMRSLFMKLLMRICPWIGIVKASQSHHPVSRSSSC